MLKCLKIKGYHVYNLLSNVLEKYKDRERKREYQGKQGNVITFGKLRVKGVWKFLILFMHFSKSDIILKQTEKNVLGTKESVKQWVQKTKVLRESPPLGIDLEEVLPLLLRYIRVPTALLNALIGNSTCKSLYSRSICIPLL